MKNKLVIFLGIFLLTLISCGKDDEVVVKTTIQVAVLKDNNPFKDVTVYLFDSTGKELKKVDANTSAVTSDKGIVTFTLEDINGVTVTDATKTFRFAIFNPAYKDASVSIKKGEHKTMAISYNSGLDF